MCSLWNFSFHPPGFYCILRKGFPEGKEADQPCSSLFSRSLWNLCNANFGNVINQGWEDEDYLPFPSPPFSSTLLHTPRATNDFNFPPDLRTRKSFSLGGCGSFVSLGPWDKLPSLGLKVCLSKLREDTFILKETTCAPDPDRPQPSGTKSSHRWRQDEQGGSHLSPHPELR